MRKYAKSSRTSLENKTEIDEFKLSFQFPDGKLGLLKSHLNIQTPLEYVYFDDLFWVGWGEKKVTLVKNKFGYISIYIFFSSSLFGGHPSPCCVI